MRKFVLVKWNLGVAPNVYTADDPSSNLNYTRGGMVGQLRTGPE